MKIKIILNKISDTICEYRGFNETNEQLFKNTIYDAHIGVVEFIGAIHALMYLKKNKIENGIVLVQDEYIKKSIETKTYKHQTRNRETNNLLGRCRYWLYEYKKQINIQTFKN